MAAATMSPSGQVCDTHHDSAPSDVNGCPYTQRLKGFINARYQRAWNGQGNPNPVLSAGNGCSSTVGYDAAPDGPGGTVGLETPCNGPPTPASVWQKLVLVRVAGRLLVDDILIDASHDGHFTSVYAQA